MSKKDVSPSVNYTIIWIGLLVGLGFYVADIIIDVFVFGEGTLMEQILHPTYHEMWMRTCVLLISVTFAIYIQILLGRQHAAVVRVKKAETFLNSIIDNIPSMVFIKDAKDLRFVRINHTAERLLGLSSHEVLGKNDYELFPESQADYFTAKDREVLESRITVNIPEEVIDTAVFGWRWLYTRKVPILDDEDLPIYLLGISEDITEAKQTTSNQKETEIRFQTLFNSAADYIFVIDPEGQVLQVNRYACENSGYKKHEIVGKGIKQFYTKESQIICDRDLDTLRTWGYYRAEFKFVCKDGRILVMECLATGIPNESSSFASFLIIQRDVTAKKQAEEDMHRHQQELAHVMRLSTMGEMASGMAHELNQPLTALASYCGTASSILNSLPSPPLKLREILDRAQEEAYRAGRIIRNLREFVGKGDNEKEPLVLDQVIGEINVLLKPELRHSNVKIEQHLDGQGRKVLANLVQIEQVLIKMGGAIQSKDK